MGKGPGGEGSTGSGYGPSPGRSPITLDRLLEIVTPIDGAKPPKTVSVSQSARRAGQRSRRRPIQAPASGDLFAGTVLGDSATMRNTLG